jgi:Mycotoxin biosynthesis protein UstYa
VRIGVPENSVQLTEELGGGYMASLEMYHQIHCVYALWKNTWPNIYLPDAGKEGPMFRVHLDHCADILRQKLECDGDLGRSVWHRTFPL